MEKALMLEKIEGRRGKVWQRMRWLDSITSLVNINLNKGREIVKDKGGWHDAVHEAVKSLTDLVTKQQQNL